MARKSSSRRRSSTSGNDTSQAVRDSAQKIWLAGLGAFERAKTDGPRMFESLVEQGRNMGARAVGAADEALKNMRQANFSGGKWDKLEQVFEERVSKSLSKLGVITGREVDNLSRQVSELNESVRNFMRGGDAGSKSAGAKRSKGGAKKRKASTKRGAATRKSKAKARPRSKAKASSKSAASRE